MAPEDRPDLIDALTLHRVDFGAGYEKDKPEHGREFVTDLYEANVVSSIRTDNVLGSNLHAVVIDLDVQAHLVPSTTDGHSHLYADVFCVWADYLAFLKAAARIGLVEIGYVNAAEARGYTSVRLPWVRKAVDLL